MAQARLLEVQSHQREMQSHQHEMQAQSAQAQSELRDLKLELEHSQAQVRQWPLIASNCDLKLELEHSLAQVRQWPPMASDGASDGASDCVPHQKALLEQVRQLQEKLSLTQAAAAETEARAEARLSKLLGQQVTNPTDGVGLPRRWRLIASLMASLMTPDDL